MLDETTTLFELKEAVAKFRDDRNWRQFHSLKNLSMAIAIEAAELMNYFKWDDGPHAAEGWGEVAMELADVVIYCLNIADRLDVDLSEIVTEKIRRNGIKYPAADFDGEWRLD